MRKCLNARARQSKRMERLITESEKCSKIRLKKTCLRGKRNKDVREKVMEEEKERETEQRERERQRKRERIISKSQLGACSNTLTSS